jgi:hypothetical protein
MKSNINLGKYADFVVPEVEQETAQQWVHYPVQPLTVTELDMDIRDEYNGFIDIRLSNGDRIIYDLHEIRSSSTEPGPQFKFTYTVNGDVLTRDLDDVVDGQPLVQAALDYYVNNYLN